MGLEGPVDICWEASFLVPGQQSFFAALYWNWLQLKGSYNLGLVGLMGELPQTRHCSLDSGWVRHVDMSPDCVLGASISLAQEPLPPPPQRLRLWTLSPSPFSVPPPAFGGPA